MSIEDPTKKDKIETEPLDYGNIWTGTANEYFDCIERLHDDARLFDKGVSIMENLKEEWEEEQDPKEKKIKKTMTCLEKTKSLQTVLEKLKLIILKGMENESTFANTKFWDDIEKMLGSTTQFLAEFKEFMGMPDIAPELEKEIRKFRTDYLSMRPSN